MMDISLENNAVETDDCRECLLLPPGELNDDETKDPELPLPLRLLYGLNGVTLSLPITALFYIVNTRAAVPVAYLSAYGAVAFLPCSLKPFYACVSQYYVKQRNALLVLLLIFSGIVTATTAFIPRGGVFWCFFLAFWRGVTSTWPEFLLGLSLIECAQETPKYTLAAAHMQSQAATCRNVGSLLATTLAFLLFLYRHIHGYDELCDEVVRILLVASGVLNLVAAVVAWWFRVGDNLTNGHVCPPGDFGSLGDRGGTRPSPLDTHAGTWRCISLCTGNGHILVLFQLCIIVIAMQGPIERISFESVIWLCFVLLLVTALILVSVWRYPIQQWQRIHRVGLFLIARHAIPDSSYLMGSFIYSQLQSTPVLLQALSIVGMGMTALSSWSYGKLFARYSHGWSLLLVMACTTTASSLLSLGNLAIVTEAHNSSHDWMFYLVIGLVGAVATFAAEWQFLPDVVLATATVGAQEHPRETIHWNVEEDISVGEEDESLVAPLIRGAWRQGNDQVAAGTPNDYCGAANDDSTGIQYGALISCIDFGDQIGAWVTVPLVTALGIGRENDWANLNVFIILTAILGLLSVLFLGILKDKTNER